MAVFLLAIRIGIFISMIRITNRNNMNHKKKTITDSVRQYGRVPNAKRRPEFTLRSRSASIAVPPIRIAILL
jgi:hypothetical protein